MITYFMFIADANIGSLKSLQSLFGINICTTVMLVKFEQNLMVRTTQNFELLTKTG